MRERKRVEKPMEREREYRESIEKKDTEASHLSERERELGIYIIK